MTSPDTGRFTQREIDLARDIIDTLVRELRNESKDVIIGIADVCTLMTTEVLLRLKREGWEEVLSAMSRDALVVAGALSEALKAGEGKTFGEEWEVSE